MFASLRSLVAVLVLIPLAGHPYATPAAEQGAHGRVAGPRAHVAGDSAALYGGYSATSPHWPHIRTMVMDFRTTYLKPAEQAQERAWMARHFDYQMSGDGVAFRGANPGGRYLPYALLWTVYAKGAKDGGKLSSGSITDLEAWFQQHPRYPLENAFLHRADSASGGRERTEATRLVLQIWDTQRRYALNPGDPGVRAYEADRFVRLVQGADGVFLDEFGAGGIDSHLKGVIEYPDLKEYDRDLTALLADIKQALGTRILMINTAEYHGPADEAMIRATGAAHLERLNNPLSGDMESRWRFIDGLLAHGVLTELVSLNSWAEANSGKGVFRKMNSGGYPSTAARLKMWELASYYMVVPASPDLLLLDLQNGWQVPFSSVWLRAQEVNIGHPTGARTVLAKGTDPTGHAYRVWSRAFDRALVLARPVIGWDEQRMDDSTAVTVPLPSGTV